MEAVTVSSMRPSALLLEHAFGRRLVEGEDEWRGVAGVVRSSFLLLYREFRHHDKRLRVLEAAPHEATSTPDRCESTQNERTTLLTDQLQLLDEELQLVKRELSELRSTGASCKCRCDRSMGLPGLMAQVAVQAQRQWHRHQKLRLKVSKIQRQVRAMRRVQHECEEIVVRTAEKQQRQVQGLHRKINSEEVKRVRLEEDVETLMKPRLKLLEKHVVVMHRKLKLVGKGPADRQHEHQEREAATVSDNRHSITEDGAWTQDSQDTRNQDAECIRRPAETSQRRLPFDFVDEDVEEEENDGDGDSGLVPGLPSLPNSRGHANLRLRYQHERKRQIRRLDRLRHSKTFLPASKHEERRVVG